MKGAVWIMKYLPGYGLPSTLTPGRIREVLGFAKSHEREFEAALDAVVVARPRAAGGEPDRELYERLHRLLRSAEGRAIYGRAREKFESKRKRSGRADLFLRLIDSCLSTALDADEGKAVKARMSAGATFTDICKPLALASAWERLAEFAWALAINTNSRGGLIDALDSWPDAAPFLKDVRVGVVPHDKPEEELEPPPEKEGEATSLIVGIKTAAAALDTRFLDSPTIDPLVQAVGRLLEISRARARAATATLTQLQGWLDERSDVVDDILLSDSALDSRMTALKRRAATGNVAPDILETALERFDAAMDTTRDLTETRAAYEPAIEQEDFARVSSLAATMGELTAKYRADLAAFDELFPILPPDPAPTTGEDENAGGRDGGEAQSESSGQEEAATADDGPDERRSGSATDGESRPGTGESAETAPDADETPADEAQAEPSAQGETERGEPPTDSATDDGSKEATADDEPDERATGMEAEKEPEPRTGRAAEIASDGGASPAGDSVLDTTIATMIERGRYGVAYHLARAAPDTLPGANVIRLVACNYVTDERTPVAAELPGLADELSVEAETVLDGDADPTVRQIYAVLVTSAALAPALIAPGGPVAELLRQLAPQLDGIPSLRTLATTAADVSMSGVLLPASLLRKSDSLEAWSREAEKLRRDAKTWIDYERCVRLNYQAATRVWRRLLTDWLDDGRASIGHIFSLLEKPDGETALERVSAFSKHWRDHRDNEIDRIDRELRNRAAGNRIVGTARHDLRNKIDEALSFADRWRLSVESRPDDRPEFREEQANRLRAAAREHIPAVLEAIGALDSILARGAEALMRRYEALFTVASSDSLAPTASLADLLNGELLANPKIEFDAAGAPSGASVDAALVLELAHWDKPDFADAAIGRAKRKDLRGARMTLEFARRNRRLTEDRADHARAIVEEERELHLKALKDRINRTTDKLDAAYARGVLDIESFERMREDLPSMELAAVDDFRAAFEKLYDIDEAVETAHGEQRDSVRWSLDEMENLLPEDRERIEDAVEAVRFQIAHDFIERVQRGEELPDPEAVTERPFDRFFPSFVTDYTGFRGAAPDAVAQIRRALEERGQAGPVDASRLSADHARDGIALLDAWANLLRDGRTRGNTLDALMEGLGFTNAKASGTDTWTADRERVYLLQTIPVADRHIAQLPDFGSRARGRYRLLTIRNRETEEAIIRETRRPSAAGLPPDIVLFLGVLNADARCALAREFGSGAYHSTLVLDEALVAFLAMWPSARLGAFFDCASAFAFAQPYDPDAVEVPPEMFFGRDDARQKILAMSGDMAHFVYGGRRLGKTALFADIAREYRANTQDQNSQDQQALLVNLKGKDELWPLFSDRLAERGIVADARTVRFESIRRDVTKWLAAKSDRRVLLLVDEADAFLDAEQRRSPRYPALEQIKGLMEETERRFKVVFAGLHNVQRAARDPNTPFAHLGEAVRIGPMLPQTTDGEEIEKLIRGPLEALGYRFAAADSVIRIAAETNYYPALAQQFCKELLRHMRENGGASGETGPPWTIPADTVDHVFDSRETRDRIRNLFSWTIQLDSRYVFLTYLIARHSFDNASAGPHGMSIGDIRDNALSEWPQGFEADSSYWMFEILLEEMIGLGILREVADREYAIRTRNLRMLLGNDDTIEREFADAKGRMAPPTFDPARFRNTLRDGPDKEIPSSLTADQENALLYDRCGGVGLVFGTRLAGIGRLRASFERAGEGKETKLYIRETGANNLPSTLEGVAGSRRPGVHVVLTDLRGDWNLERIEQTQEFITAHRAGMRTIRPIFLCGPAEAWEWLDRPRPARGRDAMLRDIWLGPCARDFAHAWLTDREAPARADLEGKGGPVVDLPWPDVLQTASGNERPDSMAKAAHLAIDDDAWVSDVLISPAANTVLRLLSEFPDDSMTADMLADLSRETKRKISPEEAVRFLEWAGWLGLALKDGRGYRLDSTYAHGLATLFSRA